MQCTTENSWIQGSPNIDLFIFEAQLSSKNRARTTGPESCALYEWMQSLYERTQLCLQAVTNPSLCFFSLRLRPLLGPNVFQPLLCCGTGSHGAVPGFSVALQMEVLRWSESPNPTSGHTLYGFCFHPGAQELPLLLLEMFCSAWPYWTVFSARSLTCLFPPPCLVFCLVLFFQWGVFTAAISSGSEKESRWGNSEWELCPCKIEWRWQWEEPMGGGWGKQSTAERKGETAEKHHRRSKRGEKVEERIDGARGRGERGQGLVVDPMGGVPLSTACQACGGQGADGAVGRQPAFGQRKSLFAFSRRIC